MRVPGEIFVHDLARQVFGLRFDLLLVLLLLVVVIEDRLGDATLGGVRSGHFRSPNERHDPIVLNLGDFQPQLFDALVLRLGHVQRLQLGKDLLVLARLDLHPLGAFVLECLLEQGQFLGDVRGTGGNV